MADVEAGLAVIDREALGKGTCHRQPDRAVDETLQGSLREVCVEREHLGRYRSCPDLVAVEQPLELRVLHPDLGEAPLSVGLTMRTPGDDVDLAFGYLYAEGVIDTVDQVVATRPCAGTAALKVELCGPRPDLSSLQRATLQSSACGVCGKSSLAGLPGFPQTPVLGQAGIAADTLRSLPALLREAQAANRLCGGLHAAALFDLDGALLALREDVGRHNALDKLIGQALRSGTLPFSDRLLLLSGRASYELLHKAWRAGASLVAAIGAPSSLAIDIAQAAGITLVGFLGAQGFNVYAGGSRIG